MTSLNEFKPTSEITKQGRGRPGELHRYRTLPIVRPGFLKKWTFYFSFLPLGGGEGG